MVCRPLFGCSTSACTRQSSVNKRVPKITTVASLTPWRVGQYFTVMRMHAALPVAQQSASSAAASRRGGRGCIPAACAPCLSQTERIGTLLTAHRCPPHRRSMRWVAKCSQQLLYHPPQSAAAALAMHLQKPVPVYQQQTSPVAPGEGSAWLASTDHSSTGANWVGRLLTAVNTTPVAAAAVHAVSAGW